ncbi:hypothetical protein HPB51_025689 [Rhipicephalus microplus]|uniref:FP protein C-terminal domain-containing protein n=1 Tax=Rhipicephalus microplus TaxID=6941 RepID=A0A9J6EQC1_RHIMP|nr:hypothetical protein HPB51_025689 [Rhipicephalus microplus]
MRDREVAEVQAEVDNLEWRSRRLNLEFHGIQETEDENLLEAINAMAIKHQFPPLAESDVVAIHRLPPRKDKTPVVICRFAKQADRDFWWKNRKKLSSLNEHFFLTEKLTKRARALLFEAKNWAKELNFKYAWHSNGKVLLPREGILLGDDFLRASRVVIDWGLESFAVSVPQRLLKVYLIRKQPLPALSRKLVPVDWHHVSEDENHLTVIIGTKAMYDRHSVTVETMAIEQSMYSEGKSLAHEAKRLRSHNLPYKAN